MKMWKTIVCALLAASAAAVQFLRRAAQTYPSRPVTVIVPYPAGGPTDTLARILAEHMKGTLGQPIIIENVERSRRHHRRRPRRRERRRTATR